MERSKMDKLERKIETETAKMQDYTKNLTGYVGEIYDMTTTQGPSYLLKDTSWFGRIWWILVVILGTTGSVYLSYKLLDKWVTSPVMVTYATKEMAVREIPFPAVTICPEAKISSQCLNYSQTLRARKNPDYEPFDEDAFFDLMALLCKSENHKTNYSVFGKELRSSINGADLETILEGDDLDIYPLFLKKCAAIDLDMADCKFMGVRVDCSKILTPVVTDEGLCYSFNMYDVRDIYSDVNKMTYFEKRKTRCDWDPDKGFKKEFQNIEEAYPLRAFLNGVSFSLAVVFFTRNSDINYGCRDFSTQGLRVSLHIPISIPRPSQVSFTVGLNRIALAAVKPTLAQTSQKLVGYDIETRNCYFSHERQLKFFKIYSQANCNLECWTNYTLGQCGCVNFYMPRDNNTNICSLKNRFCLEEARLSYSVDILKERLDVTSVKAAKSCNCLPLCFDLQYDAEISSAEWDFDNQDEAEYDGIRDIVSEYKASAVRIFFKNPFFLPVQRDELYGITDLISNFGGALGLITGFSLISLAEFIYFIFNWLIRIFGN